MPSLAGKVALVTGSSQGIGAALAVALAVEGAKVVVSDVQDCADTVEQIAEQGGEAIGVPADVTDNKSLKELVATAETALGPVDVLVNNAGIFGTLQLKPLMQISEEEWDAVFRVNARGVFQATKAVIPSMQRAGGGSIINISSGTVLRGAPMFLHYVGSKGAVFAMTRAMANELAADEIRVNSIIAGFTAEQECAQSPGHDGEDPAAHAQRPHDQARYVARRSVRRCGVSGVRCECLHHRPGHQRRWRRDHLLSAPKSTCSSPAMRQVCSRGNRRNALPRSTAATSSPENSSSRRASAICSVELNGSSEP